MMNVIILAGGFGTRLGKLTNSTPKPMLTINNQPFLQLIINYIQQFDIVEKIYITTHFAAEKIKYYFRKSTEKIKIIEEQKALGTAGSLINTIKQHNLYNQNLIVLNGDNFNLINITEWVKNYYRQKADISIVTSCVNNLSKYGNIHCNNDKIISFNEKPSNLQEMQLGYNESLTLEKNEITTLPKHNLISCGWYIINSKILLNHSNISSLEYELFEKYVNKYQFYSYYNNNYFIDIGTEQQLNKARQELPLLL
jgi:NDP-sugar pyrophosphorylase family protein